MNKGILLGGLLAFGCVNISAISTGISFNGENPLDLQRPSLDSAYLGLQFDGFEYGEQSSGFAFAEMQALYAEPLANIGTPGGLLAPANTVVSITFDPSMTQSHIMALVNNPLTVITATAYNALDEVVGVSGLPPEMFAVGNSFYGDISVVFGPKNTGPEFSRIELVSSEAFAIDSMWFVHDRRDEEVEPMFAMLAAFSEPVLYLVTEDGLVTVPDAGSTALMLGAAFIALGRLSSRLSRSARCG